MAYATRQDLIDRIGEQVLIQLTDRADPPARLIDETVLAQALGDAEAEVNAYLAGKFPLPLANVPLVLTRITTDLVRYLLHGANVTPEIRDRYRDAITFLRDVAAGRATLGLDETETKVSASDGPAVQADDRIFSKDTLRDWNF